MRWSSGLFSFALLALGRVALAEDAAPIDFSLDYSTADGCPSASQFESALAARLPAARLVAPSALSPLLRVRLRPAHASEKSEISADLPDGTRFRRELPDAACTDAMQSMAVIAAMALEGRLREADRTPTPILAGPAPAGDPAARRVEAGSTAASARPVSVSMQPAPAQAAPTARWQWSALGSVGVEGSIAPNVAPALAFGLELAEDSARAFSASVRLSGLFAQSFGSQVGAAEVHFRLLAARLELCPLRRARSHLRASACLEVEAGQLRGSAEHVAQAHDQVMPWLGVGPVAHGELALSRVLALELGLGAVALPVHDQFILRPAREVYQVPIIAWDLLIGLRAGWR